MKIPYGVVLLGGESSRMGTDKSRLVVDDQLLYQLAANKLTEYCDKVYLSISAEQSVHYKYEFPTIIDHYHMQGPIGGILSCFDELNSSLLILATDIMDVQMSDIASLVQLHEETNALCTMFYNHDGQYYEPLLSIWEKVMLESLKLYYDNGGRSLQKFISTQGIRKHAIPNGRHFKNINTLEDYKKI